MDIYNKIQSSVLACAVAALGASIYVGKQYSIPLALAGSFLGFSAAGLGLIFSRLREKKLHQNISRAVSKLADDQSNVKLVLLDPKSPSSTFNSNN